MRFRGILTQSQAPMPVAARPGPPMGWTVEPKRQKAGQALIYSNQFLRLNMVERFFRDLTYNRLRRGVFRDVEELITAIDQYVDRHNEGPKPFVWTASASDILEKVKRARRALLKVNLRDSHH